MPVLLSFVVVLVWGYCPVNDLFDILSDPFTDPCHKNHSLRKYFLKEQAKSREEDELTLLLVANSLATYLLTLESSDSEHLKRREEAAGLDPEVLKEIKEKFLSRFRKLSSIRAERFDVSSLSLQEGIQDRAAFELRKTLKEAEFRKNFQEFAEAHDRYEANPGLFKEEEKTPPTKSQLKYLVYKKYHRKKKPEGDLD